MNELDTFVARTQRNVTYAYIVMFALCLAALFTLPKPIDEFTKSLLISLASVLGTLITQQSSFWMARQRTAGIPDPTPPQVGPVANVENMNVESKPVVTPTKESP